MLEIVDPNNFEEEKLQRLANNIKDWGESLGFQQVAIVKPNLDEASQRLRLWLDKSYQGSMSWMSEHGDKRFKIDKLLPSHPTSYFCEDGLSSRRKYGGGA
jgi:epoxyqueuosine reductase